MEIQLSGNLQMRCPDLSEASKAEKLFKIFEYHISGESGARKEIIADSWKIPGFDLSEDARTIVNSEGRWLGYTAVWNRTNPYISNFIIQKIDPDFLGTDIEKTLSLWAEEKAKKNIGKAPKDAQIILAHTVNSNRMGKIRGLKNRGFEPKRYFLRMGIDLNRPLEKPQWPEGITIETHAQRKNLLDIIQCDRESFADHWGYVECPLEEEIAEWQDWIKLEPYYDPEFWFLACSKGEIVGMCLCMNGMTIDSQIGYLDSVCVRKDFRKKGIASALLKHSFLELKKAGRDKAYLHVDAESLTGATKLYKAVGMKENQSNTRMEKILRNGKSYRTEKI